MVFLATEIVEEIGYRVETGRDLKNLRLTNKYIGSAVERCIWDTRGLVINLNRRDIDGLVRKLEEIAVNEQLQRVKSVRIERLRSSRKGGMDDERTLSWTFELTKPQRRAVEKAREKVAEVLPKALRALTKVESVIWQTSYCENNFIGEKCGLDWTYDAIVQPLSSLPKLTSLILTAEDFRNEILIPRLDGITSLKRFILKGTWNTQSPSALALTSFIDSNPNLTSLKILPSNKYGDPERSPQFPPLANQELSESDKLWDFDHLSLRGSELDWIAFLLPGIKSIKKLSIPWRASFAWNIWVELLEWDIRVKELNTHRAPREFLDYVESYEGKEESLESISTGFAFYRSNEDDLLLGTRFWETSVQVHMGSLTTLKLDSMLEDEWSVGLNNVDVIKTLGKLRELSVCVKDAHVRPGEGAAGDVVHALMANLVHLPDFESAVLYPRITYENPDECDQDDFDSDVNWEDQAVLERKRRKIVQALEATLLPLPFTRTFSVSTLTPNHHHLTLAPDNSNLVFVREKRVIDAEDLFWFHTLDPADGLTPRATRIRRRTIAVHTPLPRPDLNYSMSEDNYNYDSDFDQD